MGLLAYLERGAPNLSPGIPGGRRRLEEHRISWTLLVGFHYVDGAGRRYGLVTRHIPWVVIVGQLSRGTSNPAETVFADGDILLYNCKPLEAE